MPPAPQDGISSVDTPPSATNAMAKNCVNTGSTDDVHAGSIMEACPMQSEHSLRQPPSRLDTTADGIPGTSWELTHIGQWSMCDRTETYTSAQRHSDVQGIHQVHGFDEELLQQDEAGPLVERERRPASPPENRERDNQPAGN